jgi:hypothetical protein
VGLTGWWLLKPGLKRAARIQEANCRSSLLAGNDIQPEFLSGLADAIIEAQERQSDYRSPGYQGRREMDRIQRSNRFARKRLPGALHNLRRDAHYLPVRCRRHQVRASIRRLRLRQLTHCRRSKYDAITLDERQIRGNDNVRSGK